MRDGLERHGPPLTDAWFEARRGRITASMSSHLMVRGMPWGMGEEELKARILSPTPLAPNAAMLAGQHFEVANAGWFGLLTGLAVEPDGWLYVDPERPWLGASPDGSVSLGTHEPALDDPPLVFHDSWARQSTGNDAVAAIREFVAEGECNLEMKQTTSRGRRNYAKDQPPDYYHCQVQHQMLVGYGLGVARSLLVAKVDAYEVWAFGIEAQEGYQALLDERCRTFWETHLR